MVRYFANRFNRYNLIASIFILAVLLAWVYPFIWLIFASFKLPLDLFKSGAALLPKVWTLENYARAWVQAHFSGNRSRVRSSNAARRTVTASSRRTVPLSRSPSFSSATPRAFCVAAQSSGWRSRVLSSSAAR